MRKTCCCCLSSILSIIIVLVGGIFGGGWFAYNKYAKPITSISFTQALGLLPGLYKANEGKIVTNPFDQNEGVASFESKLKTAMFLSADSTLSLEKLINDTLGGKPAPEAPAPVADNILDHVADNPFLALLQDLNFDFSTLNGYESKPADEQNSKGVLSASDKEIASLVGLVFNTAVGPQLEGIGATLGVDMLTVVKVKQVNVITSESASPADVRLNVTIGIDIKEVIVGKLTAMGQGKYAGTVSGLLPKKMFVTVEIAPYNVDVLPSLVLNEYSEKNMGNLLQMIDGILNYTKGTKGEPQLQSMLTMIDAKVKGAFKTLDNYVKLEFQGHNANLDAIQSMITALKLGNLSKVDFLTMISFLKCRDLTEFDKIKYDPALAVTFFNGFKTSYGINDNFDININNFATQITKVPDNIDLNKINLDRTNSEVKKLTLMEYDALAALFEANLANQATPAPPTTPLGINKAAGGKTNILTMIKLRKIGLVDIEKERLSILIELPLGKIVATMMPDDPVMKKLVGQLVPETMFVEADINLNNDMIPDPNDTTGTKLIRKYPSDPALLVNGLNSEQTKSMFNTLLTLLTSFGGEEMGKQFSYDALSKTISDSLSKAIDSIENNGKTSIKIGFNNDGMIVPTVFELVETMFKVAPAGIEKEKVPDEIRLSLRGIKDDKKAEFAPNIKFGSNATDHGADKLLATVDENAIKPIIKNKDAVNEEYYVNANAQLEIYDKVMNQLMSEKPIVANDVKINLKQTIFIDATPGVVVASEALNEPYYAQLVKESAFDKIASPPSGIDGKLIVQTLDVDMTTMIAKMPSGSNANLIPKSIYVTYVFSPSRKAGQDLYIVLNAMKGVNTDIIETVIQNASGGKFNFYDTVAEAINGSIKKDIEIHMPYIGIPGSTEQIHPAPLKINMGDMITQAHIVNSLGEKKGVGVFKFNEEKDYMISGLTDSQKIAFRAWETLHNPHTPGSIVANMRPLVFMCA